MGKSKQTIFVGMSGGVDSSVSAALLKELGHDVVGVFIRTWHPDFLECNEEEERKDAMRVAAHLDIPFLTFDLEDIYKQEVADYMISEYKIGRTPNPDVMCNKAVKFGAFLEKAVAMGADFVATGHYSRTSSEFPISNFQFSNKEKNIVNLLKATDENKDQSYFLWAISQAQIERIIFPIGHLKKKEVRLLAKKFNLPVAAKKDSQGICFLGDIDLKEFLKHYIKVKSGKVLNQKGETIGAHDGSVFFTLGERHGFNIHKKTPNEKPYYVIAKDVTKNTITVSQNKQDTFKLMTNEGKEFDLINTNWISTKPTNDKRYTSQVRYHGEFLDCSLHLINDAKARIVFKKPVLVAKGQSCVVYDGDICLGGGIVA